MFEALQRTTLIALYQAVLLIGILLMPVAAIAQRGGINIPIHLIVEKVRRAHEASTKS